MKGLGILNQSPLERHTQNYRAINVTLGDGEDPLGCAAAVAESLRRDIYLIEQTSFPAASAPKILQQMSDDHAWKRYFPEDAPTAQIWAWNLVRFHHAAYAVFCAVGHVEDLEARILLFKRGALIMSEIITLEDRRSD